MCRCRLVLTALVLLWVPGLLAQSLGEIADKNREQRHKKEKENRPTAKVFTDDDLASYHKGGKPSPTRSSPIPSASPGLLESDSDTRPREMEEEQWRETAAAHREAIRNAEQRIADAQARVDRINSGLTHPPGRDPNMYFTLEVWRQKALADLEAARVDLTRAKQAWEDFEEKARRNNIPPGWLRE